MQAGIEAVILAPGHSLAGLVEEAVVNGADALGVAGGDGSLAVVAAAAAAHGLPFVCVPAGTRNHFALDVGVDRHDVLGALDAFTDGIERWIDMAEVNGRLFLNNVSLGIYGDAVRSPGYRDAKVRTLLETAKEVLGPSAQAPALRVVDDAGREHRHLAVVLVSNNPYALDRPLAPARARRSTPASSGSSFSRHRAIARTAGASGASLERAVSGGECPCTGARRGRWRGGRSKPAAAVCYAACGAAGPDLLPASGRLAISAVPISKVMTPQRGTGSWGRSSSTRSAPLRLEHLGRIRAAMSRVGAGGPTLPGPADCSGTTQGLQPPPNRGFRP